MQQQPNKDGREDGTETGHVTPGAITDQAGGGGGGPVTPGSITDQAGLNGAPLPPSSITDGGEVKPHETERDAL